MASPAPPPRFPHDVHPVNLSCMCNVLSARRLQFVLFIKTTFTKYGPFLLRLSLFMAAVEVESTALYRGIERNVAFEGRKC